MNFLIYGAGAIGGYLGGALARAGSSVTFLARPAQAGVLNTRGLTVHEVSGERRTHPVRAFTSPAEAFAADTFGCVVLALKAFDTDTAIADLNAAAHPAPPILCVQNGVDNEPKLRAAFGPDRVIAGTVLTAVAAPEPGLIVIEKERGVGVWDGHPLSGELAARLRAGSIHVNAYSNADAMKWTKLLTNLMANATAAICDLSTEAVYGHPGLYAIEIRMMREAIAVMDARQLPVVALPRAPTLALGFALRWAPPKLYQPIIRRLVARGRGGKKPSFHQDLLAGKQRTEAADLNGAVARHARALGLAAPVNHALTEILEGIASGRVAWETYRGRPDRLSAELMG
jgi:2-dehydropantoate 2-reductase